MDDADALWAIDMPATTAACGEWTTQRAKKLRGADVVVIGPACAEVQAACKALRGVVRRVQRVELPGMPEGEVSEWLDQGHTRDELVVLIEQAPDDDGDPRPHIRVVPGELPRVVDEAENAIIAAGWEFYQRGALVVRPVLTRLPAADKRDTMGWRLVPIGRHHAVDVMTRVARFLKFDKRSKNWEPIDAPDKVAETWLAREGEWKLRVLGGVVTTPFLRHDGSICDRPGYDEATATLYRPSCEFPPISQHPSRADAMNALRLIEELIKGFPFTTRASRSVALSGFLTALDRRAMPTAPLHGVSAPEAGTGKSLLNDAFSLVATGREMPVIGQGKNEEEFEKRLSGCLLAGDQLISIDNCKSVLEGQFLCQAVSQSMLGIRVLGRTGNVETLNSSLILANGNNLHFAEDMCRRALLAIMDAQCERPELRHFDVCLPDFIREHRPALVVAILTVLRAWHVSNTRVGVDPLGSFETWSYGVRECLIWLGHEDPVLTMPAVRANDPKREALSALLAEWDHALSDQQCTIQGIISRAQQLAHPPPPTEDEAPITPNRAFKDALLAIAEKKGATDTICPLRLGHYLPRIAGKFVNGQAIKRLSSPQGYSQWQLTRLNQSGGG
jgi:hypothetical protein